MSFLKLDDYTVPGYGLVAGVNAPLRDEDASGETSSTARAKKGNKGKKLEVRLSIRFKDADDLRELMRVAEATENGDSKIYTITNDTANTAGMRQGRFTGNIRADEDEGLRKWDVAFTLVEHISVPEMAEAREAGRESGNQANDGAFIGSEDEAATGSENLGTVERVLKWLDQKIGPEADG